MPKDYSGILLVAPFERVWLEGEEMGLRAGSGCVSFQVKGQNDANIILTAGSPKNSLSEKRGGAPSGSARQSLDALSQDGAEATKMYTIVLGSHGNSKLKVEKGQETVVLRQDLPQACLYPTRFKPFWLNLHASVLSIGSGSPGCGMFFRWSDPDLGADHLQVGLSCWDHHVGFRSVAVSPAITTLPDSPHGTNHPGSLSSLAIASLMSRIADASLRAGQRSSTATHIHRSFTPDPSATHSTLPSRAASLPDASHAPAVPHDSSCSGDTRQAASQRAMSSGCNGGRSRSCASSGEGPTGAPGGANGVPGMDDSSRDNAIEQLSHTVSHVLVYLDLSWRCTEPLWDTCVDYIAQHLSVAVNHAPAAVALLPAAALLQALSSPHLMASEHEAFAAIEAWAYSDSLSLCSSPAGASLDGSASAGHSTAPAQAGHAVPVCAPPALAAARGSGACGSDAGCSEEGQSRQLPGEASQGLEWEGITQLLGSGSDAHDAGAACSLRDLGEVYALLQRVKYPMMTVDEQARVRASRLWRDVPGLQGLLEEAAAVDAADGDPAAAATSAPGSPERRQCSGPLAVPSSPPHSLHELLRTSRRQRRCPAGMHELLYLRDGDQHGVLYFLGSSQGRCAWMNPHITGAVKVASSSPFSTFSDPRKLASRCYHGSLCAEPRAISRERAAFWSVDLGRTCRLACNHYTLRRNDSTEYPRNWALQGSDDGSQWHSLKVHSLDDSMCSPTKFHSWPVDQTALRFFQYFRVVVQDSECSKPMDLNVNYIELYGYLNCND